jgi:hypothetical protein
VPSISQEEIVQVLQVELSRKQPLNRKQLRRLHGLWHRWAGRLALSREADRELRHYYIERFTGGRVHETCLLSESDAACVIEWLAKLTHQAELPLNQAAGTAGRHGYPERVRVAPNVAAWRALWGCASALGMGRADVDKFLRRHYAGIGLHGLSDLQTMADLNRVLWGLKAMLRRRQREETSLLLEKKAA